MTEKDYLIVAEVVFAILLSLTILVQQRGSGLSSTFGGSDGFHTSRRGAEKVLYYATIVFALLFFGTAMLYLYV